MTKSTHQILYIILFVLLAILYIIQFSKSGRTENLPTPEKEFSIQPPNEGSLNIAFVNSDTVSKYYEFAKKIQKTLTTKRSEAEEQIKSKYFAYESWFKNLKKHPQLWEIERKWKKLKRLDFLNKKLCKLNSSFQSRFPEKN